MFFATVQRIDLRHLFLGQFKAEQIQILPDVIGIAGAGDHYDAPLQIPAQDHLCGGYSVSGGNSADWALWEQHPSPAKFSEEGKLEKEKNGKSLTDELYH